MNTDDLIMERRLHRMKIIAKYKCDVCGTEYMDRKDATECENGHKKAKKIIKQVHQHMSGYPLKLEVEMSDGTKLMYKRG